MDETQHGPDIAAGAVLLQTEGGIAPLPRLYGSIVMMNCDSALYPLGPVALMV